MSIHPTALSIANRLPSSDPTPKCALGLGLREAELRRKARTVHDLCHALGLDLALVENAMTDANTAVNSASVAETA